MCTTLFKKPIAGRSSFDFNRLMSLRVNSGYNHVAWRQLFLMYKIERSRPLLECGYSIIERERRKTIVEDFAITAFPRRDPEPQEDEILFSLFLYLVRPISLYHPARCIELFLFSSALKRGHLWHRALFSQGGAIWKAICAFVRTIAITGRAGLMMMVWRLLSVPLQVVPDRRTDDRREFRMLPHLLFYLSPPYLASSPSSKSYLVESIVILYMRGQREFFCRNSYQRVYDKNLESSITQKTVKKEIITSSCALNMLYAVVFD